MILRLTVLCLLLPCVALVGLPTRQSTAQIPLRYTAGLVHGFLVLRTLEGEPLAHGDLTQVAHGNLVTSQLVFPFRDGSLHDETTVYSQHRDFRLVSDHLVQRGPSFPDPKDVSIDTNSGRVVVRYTNDSGNEEIKTERMKLPNDLANGLIFTLVKNIPHDSSEMKATMVVTTPKPRLVELVFSAQGTEALSIGGERRRATHYTIKVALGGVSGLVAPLVGKEPPVIQVWVLDGEAPTFIKSQGPLYPGGPI